MIIKFISFLNRHIDRPATKKGEYKLNDIIEVKEDDQDYYYIYINNQGYYVKVPADIILLSQIKDITWTKEPNTNVIKSCSNSKINLNKFLNAFGYTYQLLEGTIDDIA